MSKMPRDPEEIMRQIHVRRRLIANMVGELYPQIVQEEIVVLHDMHNRLILGEPLDHVQLALL